MRWFWIDRFEQFISGSRAVAVKNVSLAEEQLVDYLPGYPIMPASLIVEGLAQAGGLLVGQYNQFHERVVLAKLGRSRFHCQARPGDQLTYTAVLEDIREDGGIIQGTSHIAGKLQAEIELVFAHLDNRFEGVQFFEPARFLRMLRIMKLFEVGQDSDGNPLDIPPWLLEAEARENGLGAGQEMSRS